MTKKAEDKTLFDKLGGEKAIDIAVDLFYDRILKDKRVDHFFSHTNMA